MKTFYVAGMHRSGTSAVTRTLNLLGLSLGAPSGLMTPQDDNPTGFWENAEIAQLNERLLTTLGGSWHRPPLLTDGWHIADSVGTTPLAPWRGQIRAALKRLGDVDVAVKDPRISLLLPLWMSVRPASRVLLPLRSPDAVCRSLARRQNMPPARAAYLWLRYVGATWRDGWNPDNEPPYVIVYEDLLNATDEAIDRLVGSLQLAQPSAFARDSVHEFLNDSLNHETGEKVESSPLLRLARAAYEELRCGDPGDAASVLAVPSLVSEIARDRESAVGDVVSSHTADLVRRLRRRGRDLLRVRLDGRLGVNRAGGRDGK